jgi:hypothetical protein
MVLPEGYTNVGDRFYFKYLVLKTHPGVGELAGWD